jgi:hypothetical protein
MMNADRARRLALARALPVLAQERPATRRLHALFEREFKKLLEESPGIRDLPRHPRLRRPPRGSIARRGARRKAHTPR